MPTANGSAIGAPLSHQTSYSASKSAMAAIFGPGHRYNTKDNAKAQSGDEPPCGIQGQGTKDEPYDEGNAPKAVAAAPDQSQEPLNGVQGKGTKTEPYDQGNASESTTNSQPITTTTQPPPEAETAPAETNGSAKDKSSQPNNERGRTLAPPSSTRRQDRSVSPGTLDDGSHQLCGGERGGSYTPSSGLGRLAGKVFGSKN